QNAWRATSEDPMAHNPNGLQLSSRPVGMVVVSPVDTSVTLSVDRPGVGASYETSLSPASATENPWPTTSVLPGSARSTAPTGGGRPVPKTSGRVKYSRPSSPKPSNRTSGRFCFPTTSVNGTVIVLASLLVRSSATIPPSWLRSIAIQELSAATVLGDTS